MLRTISHILGFSMNNPENKDEYFEALNKQLKQLYCIDFDDTGYTKEEWRLYFDGLTVDEAIKRYALKYDLIPASEVLAYR